MTWLLAITTMSASLPNKLQLQDPDSLKVNVSVNRVSLFIPLPIK